ncbi:MAG: ATP-binding protein [Planctomycetia bacterium]
MQFHFGPSTIASYKRLAYTPWHALAEFIDNSTQSYVNHRDELDAVLRKANEQLRVSIVYDRETGLLRIADNAFGMSESDLECALQVGRPPVNATGRSKYGMGMKTAACWFGDEWTVETSKLGEPFRHLVTIKVPEIAAGRADAHYQRIPAKPELHYTRIEVRKLHRELHGRTLGKIREFLRSMYRLDIERNTLSLEWQNEPLKWEGLRDKLLKGTDGSVFHREFRFEAAGKQVHGWVGLLARGSRADAGFSILQHDRVIRGWPDSWRPESLYGQMQGSNDLVNQRLVGEIWLDGFDVSHTKDAIDWKGSEQDEVETKLREVCEDYRKQAKRTRGQREDERGPSVEETKLAVDEFKDELGSPELVDKIRLMEVPGATQVQAERARIGRSVSSTNEEFVATIELGSGWPTVRVKGYMPAGLSVNDPYVTVDSPRAHELNVIINRAHPHWHQLRGSEGVLNFLRHCTYDALAEWQARQRTSAMDPDTIKLIKDRLLRVALEIEAHKAQATEATGPAA